MNKFLTRLKNAFRETAYRHLYMSTFFVDNPDKKINLFQNVPGWIYSYVSPHSFWTSSWLEWITLFVKLHTEIFMSEKFDNEMRTFLVSNSDQNFLLVQNALDCIHSYSSSDFTWKNFWLDWKTLFVKLHTETFMSAKLDNDMSTSFIDHPDQKIFLFQKLRSCIHPYSSPLSIWTSFWQDWKTPFMKLHTETFWAQNLTTIWTDFS